MFKWMAQAKQSAIAAFAASLVALSATFGAVLNAIYIPVSRNNRSAWMQVPMRGASMTSYVIGIAVAALVVAIIVPIAFGQFFSTDTGSWDAQTILIWGIIPLVVILAIVLFFLNKADDQA